MAELCSTPSPPSNLGTWGDSTSTCVKYGGLGDDCTSVFCRSHLACDPDTLRCSPGRALGQACEFAAENPCVAPGVCGNDSVCVPATPAGGDCFTFAECGDDATCDFDLGCLPNLEVGEPCVGSNQCEYFCSRRPEDDGPRCSTSEGGVCVP